MQSPISNTQKHMIFPNVYALKETQQVRILQTAIRNKDTSNEDFVFYADRLVRLLVEEALSFLPCRRKDIETPTGSFYEGLEPASKICGVSIMRAGESMEKALRDTCRGTRIGKILIQRVEHGSYNNTIKEYYCKLPNDIASRFVLLLDPMLASGDSASRATRILIDEYNVREEHIVFVNVISAPEGLRAYSQRFPNVRIIVGAIDEGLNEQKHIRPGLGDFGDRYFGTN
uniref:uracil phosphoribosyltransferase n=1 Tax=Paramoeba aestuarina TaxID=180227 RepID=A0A7S4KUN0_9EUKA|mmetsp:Transcript_2585/g.3989  ORF Transcript_2585/g.3989 Transcript_2585/m.3989 type:complete len:230 (+) Transcript_2585:28-717(+)